jgi:hypothetical protein
MGNLDDLLCNLNMIFGKPLNVTHATSKAIEMNGKIYVVNIDHIPYLTLPCDNVRIDSIDGSNI